MSDLVERLRNPVLLVEHSPTFGNVSRLDEARVYADMAEAANEIDRLRAELAGLQAVAGAVTSGPSLADIRKTTPCAGSDAAA